MHKFMICEHDCVCVMCTHLLVCMHILWGFPLYWIEVKNANTEIIQFILFSFRKLPLLIRLPSPWSCLAGFPVGTGFSPKEPDLRPRSRLFLAFRHGDEKLFHQLTSVREHCRWSVICLSWNPDSLGRI